MGVSTTAATGSIAGVVEVVVVVLIVFFSDNTKKNITNKIMQIKMQQKTINHSNGDGNFSFAMNDLTQRRFDISQTQRTFFGPARHDLNGTLMVKNNVHVF